MKYIVNINETQSHLDMYNKPCECMLCRNYIETFSVVYPEAVEVLRQLCINIEYPLEIMDNFWNEQKDKRCYESYYSVKGELFEDKTILYDKDVVITLYTPGTKEPIYSNTGMEMPYFILEITNIQLPWVLDENPND